MKVGYYDIKFNLDQIIEEELPYTGEYYDHQGELNQDIKDLFAFPVNNSSSMPVYKFSFDECENIATVFEETYSMMVEAVSKALSSDAIVAKYFDCDLIRNHPYFIDYARYTFRVEERSPAIYGRFDAAYDPVTESVKGIYEFNGDTPVMLFESVHLQHRITEIIGNSVDHQFNSFYPNTMNNLEIAKRDLGISAVVFDQSYIEDMVTCETLAQIIGDKTTCMFVDLANLDFSYTSKSHPWVIEDIHVDTVFVLSPWEEMVSNFPHGFKVWREWANNVRFMEPAWRWFMSHKGIWAFITYLMKNDSGFKGKYGHLPILETYLDQDEFVKSGRKFVSKPVIGRLSSNITVHNADGSVEFASDGFYPDSERVYQEYCEPGKVEGRNNFILCMWMSPDNDSNILPSAVASTLCIREFDDVVLSLANERFIPHIVE